MPKFRKWFKRIQASLSKSSGSTRSRQNSSSSSFVRTDSDSSTSASSSSTKSDDYQSSLPNIIEIEPTKVLYEFDQLDLSQWENSVVIFVGASAGVGAAICTALVKRGLIVIGCSRTDELVNALADECKERNFKGQLFPYKCALESEQDVKDMFAWVYKKFGRIDILINNPELINDKAVKRYTEDGLREMVHKKILILILCTKEAATYMIKNQGVNGRGHIFNICSTVDLIAKEYRKVMATSSPTANRKTFNVPSLDDIEKSKIRVTAISPGKLETDLFRRVYGQKYVEATPTFSSNSYFSGHDVANALLYSLSSIATLA